MRAWNHAKLTHSLEMPHTNSKTTQKPLNQGVYLGLAIILAVFLTGFDSKVLHFAGFNRHFDWRILPNQVKLAAKPAIFPHLAHIAHTKPWMWPQISQMSHEMAQQAGISPGFVT